MNETRRIALEFAMRINPTKAEAVLDCARKFEAYLEYDEDADRMIRQLTHDMAIRRTPTEARP